MTGTLYNARIELRTRDAQAISDDLIEAFEGYSPAVSTAASGWTDVDISLPAVDLRQAATTALALVAQATDVDVVALEVMTTDEFDSRLGLQPLPAQVSVTEAAEILGVSRQAVLQRIESGSLPAVQVGKAWVIQRGILHRGTGPAEVGPDRVEDIIRHVPSA